MLLSNPYRPDPRVRREAHALLREGHRVVLLAWDREGGYPARESSEGMDVVRIRVPCSYDDFLESLVKTPLVWLRVFPRLLHASPDVIHCHDLDTLPLGLLASRLLDVPCVFDAHEVYSSMVKESVPRWVNSFLSWLERATVPRADLVITVNDILRDIYLNMGARQVVVVMNSPPEEEIVEPDPESVRRRLNLEGKKVCLYAGVLERSRNLDTIMDVFKETPDDVVLVMGGHGSLVEHVARRARESQNIFFVGWIDAREMSSYLAAADVVLLLYDPTYEINRIGTATRLLEAMALGIPVLASEGSSNGEIVKKEGIGLCIRHDDPAAIRQALHQLLDDEELRASISDSAVRASRERYSWSVMEKRLLDAYKGLQRGGEGE
jgi:glycosyltransferase involved in cell wall biosynthesis